MNVTCPSCATRYSVDDSLLTAAGRMMRCANCAYTWWHHPHSAPTPQHVQAQAVAQQTAAPQPAPQPVPQPAPMPEPEPEEAEEEEEEYEEVEEPEEIEEEEEVEEETEEAEGPELSDEEIEEAFGNEEPDPIESMTDAPPEDRADDEDESEIDPDNIPDPDPLPESLTSPDTDDLDEDDDEDEEGGGSRIGLVIAMVVAGLLLVFVAVFFLMSKQIASWVPATASIYESIGLNKKELGEGLEFKNITWSRVSLKNSEGLAVNAVIRNTTKEKQPVPYIRVMLLNTEDKVVQEQAVKPRKPTIEAGKSLGFKFQFDEPAATARRGILGFTAGPAPAKKDGAGKPKEKPKADAAKK